MGGRILSKQAIFDKVSVHLMKQMKKSNVKYAHGSVPSCLYRNPEGLACAVGCLLTDKEAKVADESTETDAKNANLPYRLKRNRQFLFELQEIHDSNHVGLWYTKLNKLADKYSLDSTLLERYLTSNKY